MKKNKNFLLSLWAIVVLLTSCTQDETATFKTPKLPDNPTDYFITEARAIDIAMEAVNDLKPEGTRSSSLHVSSVELITKGTRTANDSVLPGFYAINFEEGGFALIANDERATDVYAMSDKGQFDANANDGVKLFMDMAGRHMEQEISNFSVASTLPITPRPNDPNDPRLWEIVDHKGIPCHRVSTITKTTPFYLLETNWGQDNPYNQECPVLYGRTDHTDAGCVAIALGQIMNYHQQPQSFNGHQYYWDSMPNIAVGNLTPGTEAYSLAYLIHDIGLTVDMDYGYSPGGSAASSSICPSALASFGYSCDGLHAYNVNSVISSLDDNRPVYMSGKEANADYGHAWVCDGYHARYEQYKYYKVSDLSFYGNGYQAYHYLHHNWGWYGTGDGGDADCDSNGFYYEDVFKNDYSNYTQNIKAICNIRYGS